MEKSQREGWDKDGKVVTWKAEHVKDLSRLGKLDEAWLMLKGDEEKVTFTRHWCSGLPAEVGGLYKAHYLSFWTVWTSKEKPLTIFFLFEHHEPFTLKHCHSQKTWIYIPRLVGSYVH